ncbi:MAG TPA: hypothetical protein VM582_04395 [Candidatus Thermoplasmatota archaeon]|nr:hypothetical protein [Candidatus Thermoplasmatota archaeon]
MLIPLAASAAAFSPAAPALPALPDDALGAARAASLLHGALAMPSLPAGEPVARFLAAFDAFDAATRAGDAPSILGARLALLEAALALRGIEHDDIIAPPAMILRFSVSDDVYTEDVALVYDAGGNDVYLNNAGGNGMFAYVEWCLTSGTPVAAALFDIAGDDTYGDLYRGCGVLGGGAGGSGMLYDEAGNDVYMASNDGTIGGATNGFGFLLDVEGDDRYIAGGWGTNGGGFPGGFGTLIDLGGHDRYSATHDAVNGGGLLGRGFLYDAWGDDVYLAWGSGANGGGLGGFGLLLDEGGRDWYDDNEAVGWDLTVVPKLMGAQVDR